MRKRLISDAAWWRQAPETAPRPATGSSIGYRLIAGLLCLCVAWTPWALVWGDELADLGRAGQTFGQGQATGFALPTVDGDQLQFQVDGETQSVNTEELFPGASAGSAADFSALYGQPEGLTARGRAAQSTLLGEEGAQAEAFQSLYTNVGVSASDLRADPVWSQTDQVIDEMANLANGFGDCAIDTQFQTGTRPVHLPEIETCQQVQQGGECTLTHAYDLPPADHIVAVSGGAVQTNCAYGCIEVVYDFPGAAHQPSCPDCAYRPAQTFGFTINDPGRIQRIQVSVQPQATEFDTGCDWDCRIDALYQSWSIAFPGYSQFDSSSGNFDPIQRTALSGHEATAALRNGGSFTVANDYRFETDSGNWYVAQAPYRVSIRIQFTPLPLHDHGWDASEACVHLAETIRDSAFCDGEAVCSGAPPLNQNGCYETVGVLICPGNFGPSPVPWLNPFCRELAISADCAGFSSGDMQCWTDPQGQTHCPYNPGDIDNDCGPLEADPNCGYLGSTCIDGARDRYGVCYATESRYDCGTTAEIPDITRETAMDCAGPVRCLGNDCLDLTFEQSDDFGEAAAALQAAQYMLSDSDCTSPGQCQIFQGQAAECKQAVGGIVDCCETPAGVSLIDYIQLIVAMTKIDAAIMASESGSTLRGGWELLRDPLVETWDAVTETISSAANNLIGNTAAATSEAGARLSLDAAKQALIRQTVDWTAQVFGDAAANALFAVEGGGPAVINGTVQAGNIQLGGLIGTTLAWAMTAYLIYSVVMILIRIIWTCEEDEFELGVQRELRACHYVGSYCDSEILGICIEKQKAFCCFNTPLARIINEQAYPQLGRSWGEPEHPNCRGLSLQELERLDWARIDLSEWIALLTQADRFPLPEALDLEALTGTGSELSTGARADAAERSAGRAEGLDAGEVGQQAADQLWEAVRRGLP
ncbi:conjugal transfer protein TraN [Halochromatium roseum]|uniref:conjugal transfer protein TraN n=1 Tax=Halochromatium roseum TaxID=391920 RepID=UPI001F5DB874|nr:conjugal transfer protein TraN [Halochromatium roseum]